jgi:hypothetical protein
MWQKKEKHIMARRTNDVEEVETPDAEQETVAEGTQETPKETKVKAEPKRGQLPDGVVTPVGLAALLSLPLDGNKENDDPSNWRHTSKNGSHAVAPQMVYSYINNASKDAAFPVETVKDSIGADRQVVKIEAGLAWWDAKNQRVASRKESAAKKAAAKAERAANKPAAEAESTSEGDNAAVAAEAE